MNYALIGASVPMIMEALSLIRLGHSVTIYTDSTKVGGAWAPIDIFGCKGIDNAVHYLVPNSVGISAMNKVGIKTVRTSRHKYQVYRLINVPIFSLYDSRRSRFARSILRAQYSSALSINRSFSENIDGGCLGLQLWIEDTIVKNNINVKHAHSIEEISTNGLKVRLKFRNKNYGVVVDAVKMGQGVRISRINLPTGERFSSDLFVAPRPAGHLPVYCVEEHDQMEFVYLNDPMIKYMHLSRGVATSIAIFAFKSIPGSKQKVELYLEKLFKELSEVGLKVRSAGELKISNMVIPMWPLKLPNYIYEKSNSRVEVLLTEDLSRSFEIYKERWHAVC